MTELGPTGQLTDLLMRGGGYAVGAIFIGLYLLERRRANKEREYNREQHERTRLGSFIAGVTPDQVQAILEHQRAGDARPFGQLAIALYGHSESEIRDALAQQREARAELARRRRRKPKADLAAMAELEGATASRPTRQPKQEE